MADGAGTAARLRERFPEAVVRAGSFRDQHWVTIRPEALLEVARWLKEDPENDYAMLLDVTAVHWPEDPEPMEVVYHFYSLSRNERFRLKVRTGDRGTVPSLTGLWASADWNERETYDMFGVVFEGHPDLRRILMPAEYTDHPLRKEFPLYRG